jgi:hypothetical protein
MEIMCVCISGMAGLGVWPNRAEILQACAGFEARDLHGGGGVGWGVAGAQTSERELLRGCAGLGCMA